MNIEKKFNLLIPLIGSSQSFIERGYKFPYPIIKINNKDIIDWGMDCINTTNCNPIFFVKQEDINDHYMDYILKQKYGYRTNIVPLFKPVQDEFDACLTIENSINNSTPLIIFNPNCYFEPQFNSNNIKNDVDCMILDHLDCNLAYFKNGNMFVNYIKKSLSIQNTYDLIQKDGLKLEEIKIKRFYPLNTYEGLKKFEEKIQNF